MANKPGFDGDFTITTVENLSNQWQTCTFRNDKSTAFNGVDNESLVDVAGPATPLNFGANGTAPDVPFSFCAWVKPNAVLSAQFGICGHGDYAGTNAGYNFSLTTLHQVQLFIRDGTTSAAYMIYSIEAATSMTPAQWNHVCATYDGSASGGGISLYVNGNPVAMGWVTGASYVALEDVPTDFVIGRKYANVTTGAGGALAQGFIDELAAFKKELTPDEVTEIYNSGFVFDYTTFSGVADLVSWWRMGDKAEGASPDYTLPDQIGSNDAVMSAFLGDSTSGVVDDSPRVGPLCTASPLTTFAQAGRAAPFSLATKGILFRQRNKPYLVSQGGNPDDMIT